MCVNTKTMNNTESSYNLIVGGITHSPYTMVDYCIREFFYALYMSYNGKVQ